MVLPYTLAYLEEDEFQRAVNAAWVAPGVALNCCEAFMTVVFWLDIVLNFRTTYINSAGEEIFSDRAVIKRCLS